MRRSPGTVGRLLLAAVFAAVVATGLTPLARPGPALAYTITTGPTVESEILGWINSARVSHGLVPLRFDSRLRDLAEYRATIMATTNTLSHTIAGCLSCELTSRGIQWYSEGECIAWDSYPYPTEAAQIIFQLWHDKEHWPLLMSAMFNYVGLGVVHRSDNGKTWASLVLTESVDHTAPVPKNVSHSRSGSTLYWSWTGADVRLQTHTAGLKNFDVEYKLDGGSWVVIRSGTTARSITLSGRASGHTYYLRVRARDNRGNLSGWTAAVGMSVP
ncbi:MAG TPA: CAP domain-containing protein [Candidatus Limnocylindrales bacterium]|nr:CAP domain-containing protein [Candidatus Limnocylindrales bacterium]